jgi:hypothetical protein
MGHFARECHSARLGNNDVNKIVDVEIAEEVGLALRNLTVTRRAKGDIAVIAANGVAADRRNQRKVPSY